MCQPFLFLIHLGALWNQDLVSYGMSKCTLKIQAKPLIHPTELPVITITSPRKCPLESSCEDEFISGEPETKHIRYSELEKPHECLHCGRLFSDAKELQQHQRLHLSDNSLMSWLSHRPLDI